MPRNLNTAATALLTALLGSGNVSADTPNLGIVLSPEEAGRGGITVFPDGRGLPPGTGTPGLGKAVYEHYCLACHGQGGQGGINDALVGGTGSLATPGPQKTVGSFWPYATTLFDYIQRAMPYNAPGSLNSDEIYAVTAYLLALNNIIGEEAQIDDRSLPEIVMPNQHGFDWQQSRHE